jgi:preprotein translocase subunit YajC
MRDRGLIACCAALGLICAVCLAQTATRPSGDANAARLRKVKQDRDSGSRAPGTPAEAPKASTQPTTAPSPGTTKRSPSLFDGPWFMIILLGGFVLLYVWMGRGRRKQEAKRKEMLAALKKGDKVVTVGGIMGTVMDASKDELTVKVDETNNVRMKFARWAVRGVGEDARQSTEEKK